MIRGSFLAVVEVPHGTKPAIRGLCANEARLLIGSPFENSIKVYDAESMQQVGSWKIDRPDKMCMDRNGNVWVLQRPESAGEWAAIRFSADGKALAPKIEFGAGVIPTALCIDGRNRLLVADAGMDQQVKIYDNLEKAPTLSATLGVKGGIFAGPVCGRFGDLRFNKPTGVGVDAKGNIYVASSGSVAGAARSLSATRRMANAYGA